MALSVEGVFTPNELNRLAGLVPGLNDGNVWTGTNTFNGPSVMSGANSVAYNSVTTAGTNTNLAASNITGAPALVDLNLASGATGAFTITLPTVAALVAAFPSIVAGQSYRLRMINRAGFTGTVTTNTGWTLTGTMTLATITVRDFVVTINSATTATLQDVGGFAVV